MSWVQITSIVIVHETIYRYHDALWSDTYSRAQVFDISPFYQHFKHCIFQMWAKMRPYYRIRLSPHSVFIPFCYLGMYGRRYFMNQQPHYTITHLLSIGLRGLSHDVIMFISIYILSSSPNLYETLRVSMFQMGQGRVRLGCLRKFPKFPNQKSNGTQR